MDMEQPKKIHNPYGLWIFYGFFMDFRSKSVWIMDFLWNGYEFMILRNMDYGMDMNLVLNPSGPTVCMTV